MRRLLEMVANERVDLTPLVTHRFALDDIDEAFATFSSHGTGVLKVALVPTPNSTSGELAAHSAVESGAPV